jgi:hypothetical protein
VREGNMSIKEKGKETLISVTVDSDDKYETIVSLVKDNDIDEYYLTVSVFGWKQVSEIQRNWSLLLMHKYYVKKEIAPLIYYILIAEPKRINDIFEFLYRNYFIYPEEDEQ